MHRSLNDDGDQPERDNDIPGTRTNVRSSLFDIGFRLDLDLGINVIGRGWQDGWESTAFSPTTSHEIIVGRQEHVRGAHQLEMDTLVMYIHHLPAQLESCFELCQMFERDELKPVEFLAPVISPVNNPLAFGKSLSSTSAISN